MIHFIPKRYSQPKWQAYITESEQHFRFEDGTTVASLMDLKQALTNVPEETILHHVGEEHHLANWVEFVLKNKSLADALREQHHRWGMIVALERQLMRTLNLPPFVAQYWLRQVRSPFTFSDGKTVTSLKHLEETLDQVSDETVIFHLERDPNDIAVWVNDIVGDYELAELLTECSSRMQMHRFIVDHIAKLEEAAQAH